MRQESADTAGTPDATVPVVVVGAGLSGLVAARELRRHGLEVVVLEADDRLGGRALSETTALGSRVDLGGQWIGHDHHRVTALAAELGAEKFTMHTGLLPAVLDGSRKLPLWSPSLLFTGVVIAAVEVLARVGVPQRYNTMTLADGLGKLPGRTSRRLLELAALISWTADPDQYSIHAMTRMIRHQDGLRTCLATRGGAQEALLVEGFGAIVDGLAGELGDRVRSRHQVTSITQGEDGVTVDTTAGQVRASKVIVTVPPPNLRRIDFEPPLPAHRAALARTTLMGSVYKAIAVYTSPFWRDRGNGEFLVLDAPGRAIFDTSPPTGPGHLCVLVGGPEARALDHLDPAERRAALLGALAEHLGPEVLEPVSWHEKAWHLDEYTGGGYLALPSPGTTEGIFPLDTTPSGDIHWAGTESAGDHAGYFEGAIESGTRAAAEVVATLTRRN
ncbi:flavin monoamine oxidase family protein [Nocardia neocaledoniensis]|uniref:flavin monoamine oxidase family protein n=1 Tax=Nocardia neocaledoniensis TaxID=236511 RepID=UPI002455DD9D|nr:FAD-dependent oxidoreductase [Nocardia neocaledoniensis]